MSTPDAGRYDQHLAADVLALDDRLRVETEELIRRRASTLGLLVTQLALNRHGLADTEVDPAEIIDRANRLVGELDMSGMVSLGTTPEERTLDENMQALVARIQAAKDARGLSSRDIGAMSGHSHTTINKILGGSSTAKTIRKVAQAMGLDDGS